MLNSNSVLHKYLNVHSAYLPKAVPEKDMLTFISNKSGSPQVWKWDNLTLQIEQLTNLNDRVLSVYHSPSGEKVIIGMDEDGNEQQQFYLLTNKGEIEELIVSPGNFHYFGGWSPDESKIAFSSNRRHPGYFDVYVFDFNTNTTKIVFKNDGKCIPLCWTKNGKKIILSMPDTNIDNTLYVLDVNTSHLFQLGRKNTLARYQWLEVVTDTYQPPELTNDGKGGFLLTDEEQETLGVFKFSFANPNILQEVFTLKKWDIEEIKLSPSEKKLAYTINEGGISQLGIYNLESKTHQQINELPTGVVSSLSWLNNDELIFCLKSAVLPGDVWKISIKSMTIERITSIGEEKEVEHLWIEPDLCSYYSFDGQEIPYFYYGKKDLSQPIVVYVHGGPEHQTRSEFHPVIQFLASEGFGVVAPNVRGSMGYGRTYVKLDDGQNRMDAVADLTWLVKDLIASKSVDPEKVGIMGRSYGGFMVLAAMAHYPDIWAAGVDIVGISHFKTFLENTGPWRKNLREFEYGKLENNKDYFEQIAPLNHTDSISAPLLLFHGRNDTRVPVSEAEQISANLKGQGKQVELLVFEDEGHQTVKIKNHIKMNTMIVQFMEKYLK
ncbi:alpha/beta fold hydrolase [Virgibacillus byunsanensis]|uniref:Alpha/beta fold hydrolase n=1 Tax=Virgibacillus byunsanensis TaxID=570945 RepID=A0ABW3LHL5_9BACI